MFLFQRKRIYLDNASSTLPLKEAIVAMREAERLIGNPGGIHADALAAKEVLEKAREKIALELACKAREVIFTSGLSEAINLAILGFARKLQMNDAFNGTHWIVSSIEHAGVLECFSEIERLGGTVTYIDPDERGIFSPEIVLRAIRPETVFISIGWANNEIGVVQPIRDISRAIKEKNPGIVFHSDAGQAPLYLPSQVNTLGVDLMSFGSNKLYGPHGIGALFVKTGIAIAPIILGGGQERSLRAGTENVALAAGFAEALARIARERESDAKRVRHMRDEFAALLQKEIFGITLNTDLKHSLPHMLNISLPRDARHSSEYVALALDRDGISVSTKSACAEGAGHSHVVAALDDNEFRAKNTLRFSLGRDSSSSDLVRTVQALQSILKK